MTSATPLFESKIRLTMEMESLESYNNNANNSILILRANTRAVISNLLNSHKILRTEKGIPRDWQGLAELCGISGELIPSISTDQDPTAKVLKLWYDKNKKECTVDKLINYLMQLDRTDIVDDILPLIADDLKFYNEQPPNGKTVKPFDLEADKFILTRDDVARINEGLEPQKYDAFVLFADDDIDFATELIENMEKTYNLKLCVKERDLVVGGSEHDAVIKLITERCGRLIVIISPAFLESNANKFFYSLAQSIAIEQRQRKIIPCIYKECGVLPPELSCYFKLDFRRAGPFWNFWERLYDSIKMPKYNPNIKLSLPENSLFSGFENNLQAKIGNSVFRSVSNPNQLLSPNDIKPALHKESDSSPRNMTHSVKFSSSSMSDLSHTDVPEDNLIPTTSANSLGKYDDKGVRKTFSFYKKIKSLGSIFPKSKPKSEKYNRANNDEEVIKTEEVNGNHVDLENELKQESRKEKKNTFTLKRNKKKVALLTV